jgi:predicted esterase YcpF (UPF0227 family)
MTHPDILHSTPTNLQQDKDDMLPSKWKHMSEAVWIAPRLFRGFGTIGPRGPVDGPPAFVIPGFLANDRSCMELRRSLAFAGWRVHGWGMGYNLGVKADIIERIKDRVEQIEAKEPVLLVGWSLGGLYARELARICPGQVKAVVTLGTPFSGHLRQNNVWRIYEKVAGHAVDASPIIPIKEKPPVPTLALWSHKDGIIAPRCAYGLEGERDKAVNTNCNHMGFSTSRRATRRIAQEIEIFLKEVSA